MGYICRCYSSSSEELMGGTHLVNSRRETDAKDREESCRSLSLCVLLAFFLLQHKIIITCPQWACNSHTDHQLRKWSKEHPQANLVKAIPQIRFTLIDCLHPFVKNFPGQASVLGFAPVVSLQLLAEECFCVIISTSDCCQWIFV